MAQTPCIKVGEGEAIDYTPSGDVALGDVIVLGTRLVTIAPMDILSGKLGAVETCGLWKVPKVTGSITKGSALYWDNDADPLNGTAGSGAFTTNSALGPFAGWAAETSSGNTIKMTLESRDASTSTLRSALGQNDLQPYPVPVGALAVWDAPGVRAVAATGANDDLAVVYNTFLTAGPSIETGDVKNGNSARKVGFQFSLPPEYVAGETVTLRINAGMKTTVAGTSCTVDAQVARSADPTVDICATSAQSINSLTAADKDFTITPTDCFPGDLLDVVLTITYVDAVNGTAVIGKIYSVTWLLDIKG